MVEDSSHRKLVRHFHEPGHFHELTFSCFGRLPLLANDDWRRRLSRCIQDVCQEAACQLVAFVYMPEHVHLLVYPTTTEPDIGRFLARVKQPFSKEIKERLTESGSPLLKKLTVRERPGKTCFRFWQEGPGFDRNIFSADVLEASIDYIHSNPVRRGLCQKATDWEWSSARYYLLVPPRQQFPDLPHIHGVPSGAFDTARRR
jgi:putative transposase